MSQEGHKRQEGEPLREVLEEIRETGAVTRKMNQVCDELGSPQDAVWAAVAEAVLRRTEW